MSKKKIVVGGAKFVGGLAASACVGRVIGEVVYNTVPMDSLNLPGKVLVIGGTAVISGMVGVKAGQYVDDTIDSVVMINDMIKACVQEVSTKKA